MKDYYVKWNGTVQKWFNSARDAYNWCVKTDAAFPTNTPYECYYRTGELEFTRHHSVNC